MVVCSLAKPRGSAPCNPAKGGALRTLNYRIPKAPPLARGLRGAALP
jgi:hypothetical protein